MTTVQCRHSALLLMTDPWRACFCIFTLRSYCVNWELQQGLWLQLLETGQDKCTLIILKPLIQRIISCYCFPCTVWFLEIPVKVVFLRIQCYAFQPKEQKNNFSQNWKNVVVEWPQCNVVVLLYCLRAFFLILTLWSYCVNWELQQGLWLQLLETGQGKCTLIILLEESVGSHL